MAGSPSTYWPKWQTCLDRKSMEAERWRHRCRTHRVRNTLTVVQALARLTFKDTNLQAVRQFDQRLSALSEAHAILTATHWTGASLKEIIAGRRLRTKGRALLRDGPS